MTRVKGYAPGSVAKCPKCDWQIDLESLGWIRIGAVSYGKRKMMRCRECDRLRCMRIVRLDDEGREIVPSKKAIAVICLLAFGIPIGIVTLLFAVMPSKSI